MTRATSPLALVRFDGHQRARARSGNDTEALVEVHNRLCLMRGVARLERVPTPTVGKHGALRYAARASVDYLGAMADGRAVAVEVKRVAKGRFPLSRVEPHQAAMLTWTAAGGGVAVVLVVHGPRSDLYAVPWVALATVHDHRRWEPAVVSLSADEMATWAVVHGEPYLRPWVRP